MSVSSPLASASHTNRYAPRVGAAYIASLYCDDDQEDDRAVPEDDDSEAPTTRSPMTTSALVSPWRAPSRPNDQVDEICAVQGAPSCAWNYRGVEAVRLGFDQWLREKQERAVLEEAAKKRHALAELALQLARRERAQAEYAAWRREKAELATADRAAAERDAQRAPTAEELAARARERQRDFDEWCRAKDAARLAKAIDARQMRAVAEQQQQQLHQANPAERAKAFEAWKEDSTKRLLEHRSAKKKQARKPAIYEDTPEERRTRQTQVAAQNRRFAKEQRARERKVECVLEAEREEERQAKAKRAVNVVLTQAEREIELARHFHALQAEHRAAERKRADAARALHRQVWHKNETPTVAYSTRTPKKIAFR